MNLTVQMLADLASRVGVPAVMLFLVLVQLSPRLDRMIAVMDHVDAELQFLAARGCAPLPALDGHN